jgi:hypothetical protein
VESFCMPIEVERKITIDELAKADCALLTV